MLKSTQKEQYFRDGYLLIRNILTAEQVRWLRAFLRPKFDSPMIPGDSGNMLTADLFVRFPELRWLCFHEPTLAIVKSLFGDDTILLPCTVAHLNGFRGWHKDTVYYESSGLTFFQDQDYQMWQLAYYLQDNTPEYGGGLDIEPGSHRQVEDPFLHKPPFPKRSVVKRIWHQIHRSARRKYWLAWERHQTTGYEPSTVVSIPSRAGDLVVIDSRLNHRATPPQRMSPRGGWIAGGALSADHEKLAIFSTWSRNNAAARNLVNFSFSKWRELHPDFRFSYPADFRDGAQKAGVNVFPSESST